MNDAQAARNSTSCTPLIIAVCALLASVAILGAADPLHAQNANTPASIEDPAKGSEPEAEEAGIEISPALADKLRALRLELHALVRHDDTPREVADAEARLIDLSGDALDAREAAQTAEAKRAFAEIELRARHALVLLAAEAGEPIQTSIRSTQLRAAATRLAESQAAAIARLGTFYVTVAALGELQRDPSAATARLEVAEDRLRRLSRLHGPETEPQAQPTGETGETDANGEATAAEAPAAPIAAARVALAVFIGNVGQTRADRAVVRQAAQLEAPVAADKALARYRQRTALFDPPIRLREVIPPADPTTANDQRDTETENDIDTDNATDNDNDNDADTPPETDADADRLADTDPDVPRDAPAVGPITIVHYFQQGRPASLTPLFTLRNLQRTHDADDLEILSISLGPFTKWPEEADWPVRVSHGKSLGVAKLRVEVAPTFAVFDREGRLAVIGESTAVLDRAAEMLASSGPATP